MPANQTDTKVEALNQRGIELADKGWLEEALKEFGRAIELAPKAAFPYLNRASVYVEQGRNLDALQDLLTAIRLAPQDPSTHYHLGIFLAQRGVELGKAELHSSLQMEPDQIDAWLQIGAIHAERGEWPEAEAAYQAALDIDPSDPWANRELGLVLLDRGEVHEAIQYLRFARQQLPEDEELEVDLALAYMQAGFHSKAEKGLRTVAGRSPQNLHAQYNLAALLAERGDLDQAMPFLEAAARIHAVRVKDWLREDTFFDNVRESPRFQEFVKQSLPQDVG
ncbi:MAG TPA: tetratricopeptide repeat protein [Myxococcota bacterium]|nr:tetratricopeptide repeat protein [Myxococcota bacterium]HRY92571.1 tetratricopeptide repeat protein [Myxococcota bacterium]HSA22905.1 tetratricopeptide repeat protein [Myxococcota bacterium]